jgi:hypothetical protein
MGRRSRKRGTTPAARPAHAPAPAQRAGVPRDRRALMDEAPAAPWSPFPLVELCILLGLVLIVWGFAGGGAREGLLLACGFTLVTLASLELAVREHFAGYRSHSALLAGVCALAAVVPLFFFTALPQVVLLAVGVAVFASAVALLRAAFRARAGGLGFRA